MRADHGRRPKLSAEAKRAALAAARRQGCTCRPTITSRLETVPEHDAHPGGHEVLASLSRLAHERGICVGVSQRLVDVLRITCAHDDNCPALDTSPEYFRSIP